MVKSLKFIFTILHFRVAVAVVVLFQFQLTYLKNWTDLKLCELIEIRNL